MASRMNPDLPPTSPTAACARVLVATARPMPVPPDACFDVVDSADLAVEQAMSGDYALVLLDLALGGVGAAAAADILRRAGVGCPLVALGEPASGGAPGDVFDHRLPWPVPVEAVRDLLAALHARPRQADALGAAMGDDWIARECADLVAQFRAGLPATAAGLRAALEERNIAALRSIVHALKGSAGAYGFAAVTQRCARIEADLHASRFDAVSAAVALVLDDLEQACKVGQAHG